MMVGVVAVFISAMGRHELDHLQGAFRAADGIATSTSCSLGKGATCMNKPSARTGGDGG